MDFATAFQALTRNPPFPWQSRLYRDYLAHGAIPSACCLPTGTGKTSVVAVWLIALAQGRDVPRRLIYVVNRRTVVDQTTVEVERYREAIESDPSLSALKERVERLRISTLRGDFADNGDWCENPTRPAVICGTVDMIGSRLLFSGYGIGRNKRPLHAGFLGQDALLIHDEAHLEPAFQELLIAIQSQQQDREPSVPWPKLRVLELTATTKTSDAFTLDSDDLADARIARRYQAVKQLHLHELKDPKRPAQEICDRALTFKEQGRAVLIYAQSVETVLDIQLNLSKKVGAENVRALTGTMRGKERDALARHPTFSRFLPQPLEDATRGTVYLVCTSAGEVGVNISADHLVCDLTTFESMAQRFGRVNRFGVDRTGKPIDDCEVHVFHPGANDWDAKSPLTIPRQRTLDFLRELQRKGSVSPQALDTLPIERRAAAFAPNPEFLPATDMLFDAWALTTIKNKLPGRPSVEPFLHGKSEYDPPQTHFAWRDDVRMLDHASVTDDVRAELLLAYPLLPQELLRETSERALKRLEVLGKRHPDHKAWLVHDDGQVEQFTLDYFTAKDRKPQIDGLTVVLDPHSGGLNDAGMLDGSSETANDVSNSPERCRSTDDTAVPASFHEVYSVTIPAESEDAEPTILRWYARRNSGEWKSRKPLRLASHVADVETRMKEIVDGLPLGRSLTNCLLIAARFHDEGKRRLRFQTLLGNRNAPHVWWAKSGRKSGTRLDENYRHEFGSLRDLPSASELGIDEEERELVLHLIGAHHGRARPHFPSDEVFDPDHSHASCVEIALAVPQRFGRLQRRYGRWGLAYLESLLRAADWSASAQPNPAGEVDGRDFTCPRARPCWARVERRRGWGSLDGRRCGPKWP